jgi:hypothetical protein
MKIAMIGLGKMGANMTQRLIEHDHQVVAFDLSEKARDAAAGPPGRAPAPPSRRGGQPSPPSAGGGGVSPPPTHPPADPGWVVFPLFV